MIIYVTKPTTKAKRAEKLLRSEVSNLRLTGNFVVAIGGDGTMLHAIQRNLSKNYPFVGVSAGKLGFLQTAEANQLTALIKALKNHTYNIINAPLLIAKTKTKVLGYGFNDISLERSGARAAKFDLQIDKSPGNFIGDGVIVATPLGSTAYNLAAGGPIVDSGAQDVFLVTPNNPHVSLLYSSLQRPHILNRKRKLTLNIDSSEAKERPVKLVIDGHTVSAHISGEVQIYMSNRKAKLVELTPDGYKDRIENKRLGRY